MDPTITNRLIAYSRRRLLLRTCRLAAASTVICLLALAVGLVIDGWIDSPAARPWASFIFFGTILATFVAVTLRLLANVSSVAETALELESRVPHLRQRLLSALEIAEDQQAGQRSGEISEQFCEQIQDYLSSDMAYLDIRELLDWRSVRIPVVAVSLCLLTLFACFFAPGLHLPLRIHRLLAPTANLGRVGSVRIELLSPRPGSKLVPRGDSILVQAAAWGATDEELTISVRVDGDIRITPMHLAKQQARENSQQYSALISADAPKIDYQISAGASRTQWFTLKAEPRPQVKLFTKHILAPDYTDGFRQTQNANDGHISAVVDSRVNLVLEANTENLAKAELRWKGKGDSADAVDFSAQAFSLDQASGKLVAEFRVEENAEYQVFLQDAKTGFSNKPSPAWQVVAQEDQPATIQWLRPQEVSATVLPNALIDLSCQITDEFPIAAVEQQIRTNGGTWKTLPNGSEFEDLVPNPLGQKKIDWQFDLMTPSLFGKQVSPGDELELRLACTDLAGNETISEPKKFLVSSISIDTHASALDRAREQTAFELQELANKVRAIVANMDQRTSAPAPEADELLKSDFMDLSRLLDKHAAPLSSEALTLVGRSESRVIKRELQLSGEILSEVAHHAVPSLKALGEKKPSSWQAAIDYAKSLDQRLFRFAASYRTLVSFHVAKLHSERLQNLAFTLDRLADSETEPQKLVRELDILVRQVQDVQGAMFDSLEVVRPNSRESLRHIADSLTQLSYNFERRRNSSDRNSLIRLVESMANSLRSAGTIVRLDKGLASSYAQAMDWMQENSSPVSSLLASNFSGNAMSAENWQPPVQLFRYRRSLARAGEERLLSSDYGYAKRAIEELSTQQNQRANHTAIINSLAVLEAIHDLKRSREFIRALLQYERWDFDGTRKNIVTASLWLGYQSEIKQAFEALKLQDVSEVALVTLSSLNRRPFSLRISSMMNSRLDSAGTNRDASPELKSLERELGEVALMLKSVEDQARNTLLAFSPTIESLAHKAAKEGGEVAKHSQDLAEQIELQRIPDKETSLDVLQNHLERAQQPIAQLREALVDQADSKSLLDMEAIDEARQADLAIAMADRAQSLLGDSLEQLPQENINSSTDQQISSALQKAGTEQLLASTLLDQIARAFQPSSPNPSSDSSPNSDEANNRSTSANENTVQAEEDYHQAERLADFANRSPEEMLRDLEEELSQDPAMRLEISKIAREAIKLAIENLRASAADQKGITLELEHSDTPTRISKRFLLNELKHFKNFEFQLVSLLINETRWAAGAARATQEEAELKLASQQLNQYRTGLDSLSETSTLSDLQEISNQLASKLEPLRSRLGELNGTFEKLLEADSKINGAALNNRRREMKDRYRRVQQQQVRIHQQIVRNLAQRLRQAENDLTASLKTKQLKEQGGQTAVAAELTRKHSDALKRLRDILEEKVQDSRDQLREVNKQSSLKLTSSHPSAELAAELALAGSNAIHKLAESMPRSLKRSAPEAPRDFVLEAVPQESQVHNSAILATEHLGRSARHEARLGNQPVAETLMELEKQTQAILNGSLASALSSLDLLQQIYSAPLSNADRIQHQTTRLLSAGQQAETELLEVVAELQKLLTGRQSPQSTDQPQLNSELSSALTSEQKAQMLDDLDQMVNSPNDSSFGKKEDDSQAPSSSGDSKGNESQKPGALTEAAKQLASRLSQNREPLPSNATTDMGMATDSVMTNMDPQGPVQVQVVSPNRSGQADWGELREQTLNTTNSNRNSNLSHEYRVQVEAYFRALAERGLADSSAENSEN